MQIFYRDSTENSSYARFFMQGSIYVKNKRILMILLEFILTFDCEETRNEKNRKHEESI